MSGSHPSSLLSRLALRHDRGSSAACLTLILLPLLMFTSTAAPAALGTAVQTALTTRDPSGSSGSFHQLTYVNDEGYLMLADADGVRQQRLFQAHECGDSIHWAASGVRLVCHVYNAQVGPHSDNRIVVFDVVRGRVREVRWVDDFAWSPTGKHMAFRVSRRNAWEPGNLYLADTDGRVQRHIDRVQGPFAWKPDGSALAYTAVSGSTLIYNIATGTRRRLASGRRVGLHWVRAGSGLLLDRNVLIDLSLGRRHIIPALGRQIWFSPDGSQVLSARSARLELVDLRTLRATYIEGSTYVGLGDGEISVFEAAFSTDGKAVFWTDLLDRAVGEMRTAIYRAATDGSGRVQVALVRGAWVWFSPDIRKIAHVSSRTDRSGTLETAMLDGTGNRTIGRILAETVPVWRPTLKR